MYGSLVEKSFLVGCDSMSLGNQLLCVKGK